ncbi:MAG: hypothetical protein RIS44_3198 [Pseudomonadota bacterium]|jgi:hypothetical protein
MNTALEFHDTRVSSITTAGDQLTLHLRAAYLHKSEGEPGVDNGSGWVQQGTLVFRGAEWHGTTLIGDGWIIDGDLRIGSNKSMSVVPLPIRFSEAVSAQFSFANGCSIQITARSIELELIGAPEYVETFTRT